MGPTFSSVILPRIPARPSTDKRRVRGEREMQRGVGVRDGDVPGDDLLDACRLEIAGEDLADLAEADNGNSANFHDACLRPPATPDLRLAGRFEC